MILLLLTYSFIIFVKFQTLPQGSGTYMYTQKNDSNALVNWIQSAHTVLAHLDNSEIHPVHIIYVVPVL